jgi:cytochrome c biogenesis protein CcdA
METVFSTCEGHSRWTQPWVLWATAGVVASLAVTWIFHNEKLSSPSRIVLGFLPALLFILSVVALVRKVRTLDEMGRRLQLQAASIAFVATITLNFVSFGLGFTKIYTLNAVDLGDAGMVIWAIATASLARRYQ